VSGFRILVSAFGFLVSDFWFLDSGFGFRVSDFRIWSGISSFGFRVPDSGSGGSGSGCVVECAGSVVAEGGVS